MSMAPANSASIAEGPALKLFHSTFAFGPNAFSNQPLDFPIIACGCVMFGNAPTRTTTFWPHAAPQNTNPVNRTSTPLRILIRTPVTSDHHGKHAALVFLARPPRALAGRSTIDDVGQAGALQNLGRRVPHLEEYFVESTVRRIAIDLFAQGLGVPQRR